MSPTTDGRTDAELLDLEIDLIWGPGSVEPFPLAAIGVTADGHVVRRDSIATASLDHHEIRVRTGISFIVPARPVPPSIDGLIDSSHQSLGRLASARPDTWESDEWGLLLDGDLGPWAMVVRDGAAISVCHSARRHSDAAEAGVWTDPGHRRLGCAAGVTAAWAAQAWSPDRTLFYSTSADNEASRAVAAHLGLRQLGWIHSFHPDSRSS